MRTEPGPATTPRHDDEPRDLGGWVSVGCLSFVVGVACGHVGLPSLTAASVAASVALLVTAAAAWRKAWRVASVAGVVAVGPLGAAWFELDRRAPGVARLVAAVPTADEESVLARVAGVVQDDVREVAPDRRGMGRFDYRPPGTLATLDVETLRLGGEPFAVGGKLLLRLKEHDTRLRPGARVEATGWLRAIEPQSNPGEFDYRGAMARHGVVGRLSLASRDNWRALDAPWWDLPHAFGRLRAATSAACVRSLQRGMSDAGPALGLLETLLLGRHGQALGDVRSSFRQVGLAHVLSISGAHLGILLGLTWLVVRLVVPRPSRAATVVLVVLLMYLMALPMRTPIVRAAIMAGVFCTGYAVGRRPSAVGLLGVAAAAVLLWKPGDLASPGFQLSFGVVLAILLWTQRVSRLILPPPAIEPVHPTASQRLGRWAADYTAVSVIAFAVALPLVAWHYQLVSPLAVVMSAFALPMLTAVLGLGYVKIAAGLIAGDLGGVLAGPLRWLADTMIALVTQAERWPGASFALDARPGVAWVIATLAVAAAWGFGAFRGRAWAGAAAWGVVFVALAWTTAGGDARPPLSTPAVAASAIEAPGKTRGDAGVAARVTMLSVGDGSCFVVETPGHTLMVDCGSQAYFDVGRKSVVPALRAWGVDRLDTLVVTHADLDHFNGVLDVVDAIPTRRVITTPQLLEQAAGRPGSPTAFLVDELRRRGLEPTPVSAGWGEAHGPATVTALWPPVGFAPERDNDASLVLSIELTLGNGAGADAARPTRRILLSGDAQHEAKPALLALHDAGAIDLSADVADLPHHGSFVDASPAWLAAVSPPIVLQSTGHARLRRDPWAATLAEHAGVTRYATPYLGSVTVTITADGGLDVETWR